MREDSDVKQPNAVIASEAKQSIARQSGEVDCFVASLPCANASRLSQAMTAGHDFAISPHVLARALRFRSARSMKGRRECRAHGAPAASRTIKSKVHECRHHRSRRDRPAFPTQRFTDYDALSLVRRAFWPPSPAELLPLT